jgi:hypothetical protein
MNLRIKKFNSIEEYMEYKIEKDIKIVTNLNHAYFRLIAELKNYITVFLTTTFGNTDNMKFDSNTKEYIKQKILHKQCDSLNHFLKKMRKSKKIKHKIYYFAAKELQSIGNLHLHASVNIHIDDLIPLIEFIFWFKKQKFKNIGQIGRTFLVISNAYKKMIEDYLKIEDVKDKKNPEKIYYWFPYLENRTFNSGEITFIEFVTLNDLEERYNENITKYITKTIIAQYDLKTIKTGVIKSINKHNLKGIIKSAKNLKFREQVKIIRNICGKVYTTSRFPVSFHLYQRNYTKLVKINKKFKSFYNVIKSCERGYLQVKNGKFFYMGKEVK